MKQIIFFILQAFALYAHAQITLSGTVRDREDKRPLENVIITIKNAEKGSIIKFTQTDSKGSFTLQVNTEATKSYMIEFSLMSYQKQLLPLEKKSRNFNIALESTSLQLKEVTIKAHKIGQRGDTILYNVAGFAEVQDKTIGDVLKKMPGIHVNSGGKISYNGIEINKFYIEGQDLLEGRYGLATNSIPHKDVGRIEVLENHQPIRVMQDISFSEQAAINLKLKDSAKARWVTTLSATGGYAAAPKGALWNAELFAMLIKKGWQNMTTIKSNNTGDDLSTMFQEFSTKDILNGNENKLSSGRYINPLGAASAGLEKRRTLFNESHLFSTSLLWGLKNGAQLKTQLNYLNNREKAASNRQTVYHLSDDTKVITEDKNSRTKQNSLSIRNALELNNEKSYLKNILKTDFAWNNSNLWTEGWNTVLQKAELPIQQIENDLQWVKRVKRNTITFTSNNQWQATPQQLQVIGKEGKIVSQDVDSHFFYTNENAAYSMPIGKFMLSMRGGVSGLLRTMKSEATGMPDSIKGTTNDITTQYFKLYVRPELNYNSTKWKASLHFPLSYYYYHLGEQFGQKNDLSITARMRMTYFINNRLQWSVSASANRLPVSISNLYPGLILTNYRTLQSGISEYAVNTGKGISTTLTYKDVERAIFSSLSAIRNWNSSPFLSTQAFIGDYLINSYQKRPIHSDSWLVMGTFSSSVDLIQGMIDLSGTYITNHSSMLSGESATPYRNSVVNLNGRVNGQLTSHLNWFYQLACGMNILKIADSPSTVLHQYQHSYGINIIPSKKFYMQLKGEYYHNEIARNKYKDVCMADFKASYSPHKSIEISAHLNNLFNHQTYNYTVYNELNTIESRYTIRGREFLVSIYIR